jgi:hypothetical protein
MIRRLPKGGYRLYSRKKDPRTGKRAIWAHSRRGKRPSSEREVQFFKRQG